MRELLVKHSLAGYLVPSGDAHQSEYIQERDKRRHFISNFTGSSGLALIGKDHSWLWTDGRYWNQASLELSKDWTLMKVGVPQTPDPENFILKNFPSGSSIGVDPTLLSIAEANNFTSLLSKNSSQLAFIKENLVDSVWEDRPGETIQKLLILDVKYAGRSLEDKLQWIRKEIADKKVDSIVLTALDEIAWLFNLRGFDIPYNPVLISYAIISQTEATLYLNKLKLDDESSDYFKKNHITLKEYQEFFGDLEVLSGSDKAVWIDNNSSIAVYNSLKNLKGLLVDKSPVTLEKSLKNPTELNGFRQSSIRDAAALVNFFSWLENEINGENSSKLTETSVAEVLLGFRKQQEHFLNPSFATISATGPNASIIHYHPDEAKPVTLRKDQIFLCDSGGQYLDGTTDVTRTFHFGVPTPKELLAYTAVLKGFIQMSKLIFPNNVTGLHIDAFARQALWEHGLDYRHGTGHGVGHFLNVHEGPHQVSFRPKAMASLLYPNMIVTNEPGYYEDGKFGIRIENILAIKEHPVDSGYTTFGFLSYETLTYVPLDYKLIDVSLLTPNERSWINEYHLNCLQLLSPLVKDEALAWLKRYTQPI
uniref:Peptidase M24 domain-containing protein n=1 Tax=Arcella intermedia TaxID=1963864 RepID=A0A6B2L0I2_9EUKA